MLSYQVGLVAGTPVTLGGIENVWSALSDAQTDPLVDPTDLRVATVNWQRLRGAFQGAMALSDHAARRLVLHNLGLDEAAKRGSFMIGGRLLTPGAARVEVSRDTELARPLISLGRHFAASLVAVSGLDL